MKTEKQIDLLAKERYKEFKESTASWDRILIDADELEEQAEDIISRLQPDENISFVPFLKNGIMEIKMAEDDDFPGDMRTEISFEADFQEDFVKTEINFYDHVSNPYIGDIGKWNHTLLVEIPYLALYWEKSMIKGYSSPSIEIFVKQNRRGEEIFQNIMSELFSEEKDYLRQSFFDINMIVNYMMQHPEEKLVEEKKYKAQVPKRPAGAATENKKTGQTEQESVPPSPRIVKLNNVVTIRTRDDNVVKTLKSRRKVTGSWSVRGHFRHYKSGKVVYIKPFEKGKDKAKRMRKSYHIR